MTTDKLPIIALAGKAGSGKDTLARILVEAGGPATIVAFAEPIKSMCSDVFGFSEQDLHTREGKARVTDLVKFACPMCGSDRTFADSVDGRPQAICSECSAAGDSAAFSSRWSVRDVMKRVGDAIREIDAAAFARTAIGKARIHLGLAYMIHAPGDVPIKRRPTRNKFVVISDCRFRSEFEAVRAVGGEVWRVRRPEADASTDPHPSESEVDTIADAAFDRVVVNDATVEDLRATATVAIDVFLRSRGR